MRTSSRVSSISSSPNFSTTSPDFMPAVERRTLGHVGDQRALGLLEADGVGHVLVDVLDAHAEPAAAGLAEVAELVDDAG